MPIYCGDSLKQGRGNCSRLFAVVVNEAFLAWPFCFAT